MNINKNPSYASLPDSIKDLLKASNETTDSTISKLIEFVRSLPFSKSIKPGVELVRSLEKFVDRIFTESIEQEWDIKYVSKGIVIGAFRASEAVRQEAHKTIDYLVQSILTSTLRTKVDLQASLEGMMEGVLVSCLEKNLNIDEALAEAATNAVLASKKINLKIAQKVYDIVKKSVNGIPVRVAFEDT